MKNPNPIHIIKILPGVTFEFRFILHHATLPSGIEISAENKQELFRMLLCYFGVGAKQMSDTAFCCPFPMVRSLETLHRRPEERILQPNSLKFGLTRSCFVRFVNSANASPIPLGEN